jgi:hypothetical protein
LWDDESSQALADKHVGLAKATGALAVLPSALTARITAQVFVGELAAAERLVVEQRSLTDAMGICMPPCGALIHAAWRGCDDAGMLFNHAIRQMEALGESGALRLIDYCRAVVNMGLGRYDEALMAAMAADAFEADGFAIHPHGLSEIVESAVRIGEIEVANSCKRPAACLRA